MPRKPTRRKASAKAALRSAPQDVTAADLQALFLSMSRLADTDDEGDEALDLAQEKAFDAMEARTARKRIALAQEALALSPLCADAYGVLAGEAADPDEALELRRKAVAAGAEALGEALFKEEEGSFWGLIQTRPYMRAREALATALWRSGAREEAVGHYEELLRLNPNDNQGIRYILLDALLALGRDPAAEALLTRYDEDDAAAWEWSRALLIFRREGDTPGAQQALRKAAAANRHVTAYLLGQRGMPKKLPELIGWGGADEAVVYVDGAAEGWAAAEGAMAWVARTLGGSPSGAAKAPRALPAPEADPDRIDEAVLALLVLGLHAGRRVRKTFDLAALMRLHARGLIADPATPAKSVVLTEAGLEEAQRLHRTLFAKRKEARSERPD